MEVNNKIKNTRVCTFTEDYFSKIGAKENAASPGSAEPIYKKGSTHAIEVRLAAMLKDKGAKFTMKMFDEEGAIKRAKAQLAKNRERESKMQFA